MDINESTRNHVKIIELDGRLTLAEASAFRASLLEDIAAGTNHLVFDLSRLDFIDSSGLSVFISVMKRAREAGGDIAIASPTANVLSLFKLTHLHRVIDIVEDPAIAVDRLARTASETTP